MAPQDLTPQLRTRLSRMERVWSAGLCCSPSACWFSGFENLLTVYAMAGRKGWFLTKATYFTFLETAAGLRPGATAEADAEASMPGSSLISKPMPAGPDFDYNVYVEFPAQIP